jgi:hypothetical protein
MRRFIAAIVMLAGSLLTHAHHDPGHGETPVVDATLVPLWVGPAFSGSWYSTDRSGEGFILQVLDNGTALLLWFTYPPAGTSAQQAWIYADGGIVEGDRIRFDAAVTTRGGRFAATGGNVAVQRIPWGSVEFRFGSCSGGTVTYAGPAAWGSGTRPIARLTEIAELGCGGKRQLTATGTRAMNGLKMRSGAWFNPASDADGWAIEELASGGALVYWFTHEANGEQAWTYGEAPSSGDSLAVTNYRPVGTRFGSGFDASRVNLARWGTLQVAFNGCEGATVGYASTDAAFGSGSIAAARLTNLAGSACLAAKPNVPASGSWSTGATMPSRESEIAIATSGTRSCIAGGFPARNAFQCYDAQANSWTTLPALPAGRDHGEAFFHEGAYHFTGGDGEAGDAPGWRFDFTANRWSPVAELPPIYASGAAMLGGYVYFGGAGGMVQYDPKARRSRNVAGDGRARDHSQLVAFQGEIWMMGGRNVAGVAHPLVSIWDPASETWRSGPQLLARRAGFAAAATATTIFLTGGELLDTTPRVVLNNAEAISAGDASWTALPPIPNAVHGVGGAIHGNAFYAIGGSRSAGTAVNFGEMQVYRFGQ